MPFRRGSAEAGGLSQGPTLSKWPPREDRGGSTVQQTAALDCARWLRNALSRKNRQLESAAPRETARTGRPGQGDTPRQRDSTPQMGGRALYFGESQRVKRKTEDILKPTRNSGIR